MIRLSCEECLGNNYMIILLSGKECHGNWTMIFPGKGCHGNCYKSTGLRYFLVRDSVEKAL